MDRAALCADSNDAVAAASPAAWRRAVGFAALAGSALYVTALAVAGARREGYAHGRQLISELGEAGALDGPWFRAMLLVVGAVALALALALHRSIGAGRGSLAGPIFVALVGLSLICGGIFPCDPTCAPETLPGWLHILTSIPGSLGTLAAPFLFARRARRDPRWAPYANASRACGWAGVALMAAAFFVFPPLGLGGLGQRLVAAVQLGWFVVMGLGLVRLETSTSRAARASGAAP